MEVECLKSSFIEGRKPNISLVFITQSYFAVKILDLIQHAILL